MRSPLLSALKYATRGLLLAALFGAAGAAQAQGKTLRLAWTPSSDVPQIAVAIQRELWKSRGLEVSVVTFPTGRESLEALLGGQVDVAAIAEFPAVTAALRNQPFGVLADLSRYRANRIVTTTDISGMAALAGKKVGTTVGTNAQFQIESALAEAGATATIVNAAPADLLPTLVRKDIDAAAMFPAFVPRAKQMLGAQYREIATPGYVTHFLLVGTEAAMREHAPQTQVLLAGLIAADGVIEKEPAAAQQAVVKATNGALPLAAVAGGWADYEFRVVLRGDLVDLMAQQAKWIAAKGFVKGAASPETVRAVIKPELLRQAAADRVTLK